MAYLALIGFSIELLMSKGLEIKFEKTDVGNV